MTHEEMMRVDARVREGLGVRKDETIKAAAARVILSGEMGRKRLCATIIVAMKREPWETLRVAAKVLDWGKT